jgi:hypothetical protein
VSASHTLHVAPTGPQVDRVIAVQAPSRQQPLGQVVASHVQTPLWQRWPGPHGADVPHSHAPDAEHPSLAVVPQSMHVPPFAPQLAAERVVQVVPLQQPSGHDVASQLQSPSTQRCPSAHAGFPPHEQSPAAEQPSASSALHAVHDAPPVPQVVSVAGWQTVPLQQPSGHGVVQLEQAPLQVSPEGHAVHCCPAFPQAEGSCPLSQVDPLQHPSGHDAWLHVHAPPTHACPALHAASPPQAQVPDGSHESLVAASHPGQMQAPATHCWAAPQGAPLPHAAPGCA